MLSERHAQVLAEIERCLADEDPALARRFTSGWTTAHWRWSTGHALIVVALVLMVGCAVLGLTVATMACAALAVCALLVHLHLHAGRRTPFRPAGQGR